MDTAPVWTRNKKRVKMETFSTRLSEAIDRSGLGRPEFAARAGVGTSALAKWLSGKLTPKSDQLLSLATLAGVTMEWLLTGKGGRTHDETIDNANAYLKSIGGEPTREEHRESLRRLLEKQQVSATMAALEKRAEAAESKLKVAEAKLAAVKRAIE